MSYLIKLLIPLGLGVLAAVINFYVLATNTTKIDFVTVAKDVPLNEPFDLANAQKLSLPPQFKELGKTIVPWSERGVLSGKRVQRAIKAGDPVFFADTDLEGQWLELNDGEKLFPVDIGDLPFDPSLLRIGNEIQFRVTKLSGGAQPEWIGPYRVVAVGAKLRNDDPDAKSRTVGDSNIGIAYNMQDERMRKSLEKLEAFCDQQRQGTAAMLGVLIEERKERK